MSTTAEIQARHDRAERDVDGNIQSWETIGIFAHTDRGELLAIIAKAQELVEKMRTMSCTGDSYDVGAECAKQLDEVLK